MGALRIEGASRTSAEHTLLMNICPETLKAAFLSKLLRDWTVACICSSLLSAATMMGFTLLAQVLEIDVLILSQTPLFLISGIAQSVFHWWVLRREFRRAYWWIVIAVLGGVLSSGFISAAAPLLFSQSQAIAAFGTSLISVLVMGCAQSLFFATRVKGAWYWLGFNVLAALLVFGIYAFAEMVRGDRTISPWVIFLSNAIVSGTLTGIVTGIPLVNFVNQKGSLMSDHNHE
jgi:hypothetical protein